MTKSHPLRPCPTLLSMRPPPPTHPSYNRPLPPCTLWGVVGLLAKPAEQPLSSWFSLWVNPVHSSPPHFLQRCFSTMTPLTSRQSVALPTEQRSARDGRITKLSAPLSESMGRGDAAARSSSSRRAGGRRVGEASLRVVVDLREFRSVLPNLLHQARDFLGV